MASLVTLTVIIPMIGAAFAMLLRTQRWLRELVVSSSLIFLAVASTLILLDVKEGATIVSRVGGWAPELGVVLVADMFAALVLFVASLTILAVEIFSLFQRRTQFGSDLSITGPILLVLSSGVALAVLTGDLFTLFVSFELILISSYVLLTHQGQPGQIRSGMTYVVMNLLASTLFLVGIAFVYGATGTVNLALLAERIPELSDGTRIGIGTWFLVVFGTKAAMFPVFSWLPDSYPTAPTTITAIFAGLLTKIGVYAIIRFHGLMGFDDLGALILTIAALTMVTGVLGALAQNDMKRILSFHIVSQIGYMLMAFGLFTINGVAAAIFFLFNQIPTKTVLFLSGGLVEASEGTSSLKKVGGLAKHRPEIAFVFGLPALSLAGIPPFSGFVAKFGVVASGVAAQSWWLVAVALGVSLLTLLSMAKIWVGVFWGKPADSTDSQESSLSRSDRSYQAMTFAALATVGATLAIALFAGPIWDMSIRAAEEVLDSSSYIEAVMTE